MKSLNLKFLLYYLALYIFISLMYFSFQSYTNNFDTKLREIFFEIRGEVPASKDIVIVDIDEKSLTQLGQWPVGRDKMAQTLINLTNAQVGIIGLDIVFAEYDRLSPHTLAQQLNVQGNFLDHDSIFGNIVANTPTILGYFFTNEKNDNIPPNIATPIVDVKNTKMLLTANGVVPNIIPIQENSYSSGFFNAAPSSTGKITQMPLMMKYQNNIYPSLSLEIIRAIRQVENTQITYEDNILRGINLDDFLIPTDDKGFFTLNFRGPQRSFKYISFADIYNNTFDEKEIQGKIVLIGTSVTTLADLRATVYDLSMPGVEIHATILDNIFKQDFLYMPTWSVALDALMIFALILILGYILFRLKPIFIFPFVLILTSGLYYYFYDLLFSDGIIVNLFFPLVCIISSTLLTTLLKYFEERKISLFIKSKFAKKVCHAVMEDLLQKDDAAFKVKNAELTVFFSDLRDFTKISEKLNDPQILINLLNCYMEPMTNKIIEKEGTIDKFIGDAIMAYWNAPQVCIKHADFAVTCALNQLEALSQLNLQIKKEYDLELDIGIGLNSGLCTVGEMGSLGRSDYTIIGDNVNLASRVEGLTKFFGVKLIITEQTKRLLKDTYTIKELATVKVKGKEESTTLFEVIDLKNEQSKDELLYQKALDYFKKEDVGKALELFLQLDMNKYFKLNQLYIQACQKQLNKPSQNFNPIFDLDFK